MDIKTLRQPKILGMSIFDLATSFMGAWLIGHYGFHLHTREQWGRWLLAWTILGIVVHAALGVHTMLGYYLGINPKPERDT